MTRMIGAHDCSGPPGNAGFLGRGMALGQDHGDGAEGAWRAQDGADVVGIGHLVGDQDRRRFSFSPLKVANLADLVEVVSGPGAEPGSDTLMDGVPAEM